MDQSRGRGYSGADLAGYLGVTNFCVTLMISASLSYSNTELSKRMASASFSGTSSLDKKPSFTALQDEKIVFHGRIGFP